MRGILNRKEFDKIENKFIEFYDLTPQKEGRLHSSNDEQRKHKSIISKNSKNVNIKNIIFDFDGVILDSIPVKTEAFRKLFSKFDKNIVEKFIEYHIQNGGISRYKKIEYFFKELLNKDISEKEILNYAEKYSILTKQELSNKKYLIKEVVNFIKNNYWKYNFHIASGADKNDLRYICDELGLTKYFLSINGSPKIKNEIVKDILNKYNYKKEETILIGDSVNDYEAVKANNIEFCGYNNEKLLNTYKYINSFGNINDKF